MWILILTALISCTDASIFLCSGDLQREQFVQTSNLQSDGFRTNTYSDNLDKCACTLTANGTVFVKSRIQFMKNPDSDNENSDDSSCGPLLRIKYQQTPYYACPTSGMGSTNDTSLTYHLRHMEQLSIEIINSEKTPIQAFMSFKAEVFDGTFSIECREQTESSTRGACPCTGYMVYGAGDTGFVAANDVSAGTRAAIGIVCVIIFLVIFGVIFALWWFKLRNKGDSEEYPKDAADGGFQPQARPPQGLTHIQQGHDNPQFTQIKGNGQQIGFEPDPELNLALQTTPGGSMGSKGLRGSTDSGLYSQGNGQYYANVPGEHGVGLPPDMLYTPGLNISGHADLQGPTPARSKDSIDVNALYAKPGQGPAPAKGPKSGSHDQLHPPHPEWAVNECYVSDSSHNASQGSLNTSQPVVETDV